MKSGPLVLRRFFGHAEHFARGSENDKLGCQGESFKAASRKWVPLMLAFNVENSSSNE